MNKDATREMTSDRVSSDRSNAVCWSLVQMATRRKPYASVRVTPVFRFPRSEMILRDHENRHPDCTGHIDTCCCSLGLPPGDAWYKKRNCSGSSDCESVFALEEAIRIPTPQGWQDSYCCLGHDDIDETCAQMQYWYHFRHGFVEVDQTRFSLASFLRYEEKRLPTKQDNIYKGGIEVEFWLGPPAHGSEFRPPKYLLTRRVDDDKWTDEQFLPGCGYLWSTFTIPWEKLSPILAVRVSSRHEGWCMHINCRTALPSAYQKRLEYLHRCLHCGREGSWCQEHGRSCAHCGQGFWCSFCVPTKDSMLCDACRPNIRSVLRASDMAPELVMMLERTMFTTPLDLPLPCDFGYEYERPPIEQKRKKERPRRLRSLLLPPS